MNAETLTKALGGRWSSNGGEARCPAHEDKTPSLSIRDGDGDTLLTHCHAGCSAAAVWAALADRRVVDVGHRQDGVHHQQVRLARAHPGPGPAPNRNHALELWRASQPAAGTPAESYLRGRGITVPIPHTIRYHPAVKHTDTGVHLPCMVAAVADVDRHITGITRTYLTLDGRKAPVNRPRMALGTLTGGAVRLAAATDRVWLVEGVEDGLAVVQLMGEPAWATLGTSGFKTVVLPENIRTVILAPDGDDAGQAVIQDAARRLAGQGREVRAAKLPPGKDWIDVLDTYEERAGTLEFDLEIYRDDAEAQARREAVG